MTHLDKQGFLAWAFDELLANTTRGVLAEYIVATALGISGTKRVEWDKCDLYIDGVRVVDGVEVNDRVGVEVKSAAYVQAWPQTGPSVISFDIGPTKGWDAPTNTYAAIASRCAVVYVFCLLTCTDREHVNPLDIAQWTFYVLSASELDRKVPTQKTIRLEPLKSLRPRQCKYDELKAAIYAAAAVNRGD
ncbi:hypothetical protein CRM90_12070 [Mycobacterium sp. ENV421]|uniref:hypothetical protein n=1 Tax=Mycobacterium sp. ENV421 TaxID=1213407 RepID=UPI000C9CAE7A|nr:hypothetical protein [Mycobacterium sp. ENV421]PND57703.1 hypothetical protein CRM90_12070 [Mycobacterium sp. ENV421]